MANVATLSARAAFDVSAFQDGTRKMLSGLSQIRGALKGTSDIVKTTENSVEQLGGTMAKSGTSFRSMIASSILAGGAFASMNAAFNLFQRGISSFISGVKWGTSLQIQAEQAAVGFEVMLGSAAKSKKMIEDIGKFALETPFDVAGITSNITLLSGMGIADSDLLPALKTLGDLSLGNQEKLAGLALAFGQVQAKGKLMAQEFNQFAERGINLREMIANNLKIPVSEVAKAMEDGKVSAEVFRNSLIDLAENKFGGLMEKQAGTLGGMLDKIREKTGLIFKDIATGLFGESGGGLKAFETFLEEFRAKHVPALVAALKGIGEQMLMYSKLAGDALGLNDRPIGVDNSSRVSIANAANVFGMQNENIAKQQARLDYIRKLKEQGAGEDVVAQFIDQTRGKGALNKALQDINRNKQGLQGLERVNLKPEAAGPNIGKAFEDMMAKISVANVKTNIQNKIMSMLFSTGRIAGNAMSGVATAGVAGMRLLGMQQPQQPLQTTGALRAGSADALSAIVRHQMGGDRKNTDEKQLEAMRNAVKHLQKISEAITKEAITLVQIPDLGFGG